MSTSKRSALFQNVINRQREQEQSTDLSSVAVIPGDEDTLSPSEAQVLAQCEHIIDRGLRIFFEVGTALLRVRDLRLYRSEYPSFEAYCADRWGIERRRAYQLMDAATIHDHVNNCTQIAPANEAQVRPLLRLADPEQQRQAWMRVVEQAADSRITARLVSQVVEDFRTAQIQQYLDNAIMSPVALDDLLRSLPTQPTPVQMIWESLAVSREAVQQSLWHHWETLHTHQIAWQRLPPDPARAPQEYLIVPGPFNDDMPVSHLWLRELEIEAEIVTEYPDDLEELIQLLRAQGYTRQRTRGTRQIFRRAADDHTITVVPPPEPGTVRIRAIAHKDESWPTIVARLHQIGIILDTPRPGHLPKYPEVQRAYGTLDLHTTASEPLRTDGDSTQAVERLATALTLIEQQHHHIVHARHYAPTSARGAAVAPLLDLLEQVWQVLQTNEK